MKDLELWLFILDEIVKNEKVILISVLDSELSSPGKAGFKIAVSKDKKTVGTIGGGIMEFNLIDEAAKMLSENQDVKIFKKLHHNPNVPYDKSGLICNGTQTIFIYSFSISDLKLVEPIIDAIHNSTFGKLIINQFGITFIPSERNQNQFMFSFTSASNFQYEENIGVKNIAYVIGGGHVGLSVAKVLSLLNFYVISFDNRNDVETMKKNIYANEKIITDYNEIEKYIQEGNESYVVVVTASYPTDKIVLKHLANKKFKYIGSMGSDTKINKIFSELKEEGITSEIFNQIHAPIGIDINSETPDEIAISIAAEIIKVKNS